jgi:hypothetical protein
MVAVREAGTLALCEELLANLGVQGYTKVFTEIWARWQPGWLVRPHTSSYFAPT